MIKRPAARRSQVNDIPVGDHYAAMRAGFGWQAPETFNIAGAGWPAKTGSLGKAYPGHRIGPGEIENCLLRHPGVVNAAAVPRPEAARGAVVKAYVLVAPSFRSQRDMQHDAVAFDAAWVAQLQEHVRGKLAPYEYPKAIECVVELPMTSTGKVPRRVLRLQEQECAATNPGQS